MRALAAVSIVPLFAVVALLQGRIDGAVAASPPRQGSTYLPSPGAVRRLYPGFENLMADVYWLRAVQYYGGQRAFSAEPSYELLLPLIQVTVALDPRYDIAYRYGAIFLAEPHPAGAGSPEAGVRLLEQACRAMPRSWRMRQELGFFVFFYLKDPQRAARVLLDAAEMPGAAYWLKTLAADMLEPGSERRASRVIWTELYRTSEPGPLRETAKTNLQRLDALEVADAVEVAVRNFRARTGAAPQSLDELARAAGLKVALTDATGVPFAYDPASGKVTIARSSALWKPGLHP